MAKEYRIYYSPSQHDSWIQGGYSTPTQNREDAEKKYDSWKNYGHDVHMEEREVSSWKGVSRAPAPNSSDQTFILPNGTECRYRPHQLRFHQGQVAELLRSENDNVKFHKDIANVIKLGIGGWELAENYFPILDALRPDVRDGMFAEWPRIKLSHFREGLKKSGQDVSW